MASLSSLTATGATGLAIGPNGSTNPVLVADCSVSSAATGLKITGRAATAGADLTVVSSGTNENLVINAKGSGTVTIAPTSTGAIALSRNTAVTGTLAVSSTSALSGATTVASTSATALTVGANGATNPVVQVDANTASVATGLKVTGAAAASGLALAVISSGTNENLTIDAKGSGTVAINATGTGAITLARATTCSSTLGITGDVAVNTDKFTVAASSGNTVVAGTLTSTGAVAASSTLAVTGMTTLTGGMKGGVQALSGAGAVNVTTLLTKVTSTGANALTLADGADGQVKIISMIVDAGDATLTPTNLWGGTTITFDAVGDTVTLVFAGTKWAVAGISGAVLA